MKSLGSVHILWYYQLKFTLKPVDTVASIYLRNREHYSGWGEEGEMGEGIMREVF